MRLFGLFLIALLWAQSAAADGHQPTVQGYRIFEGDPMVDYRVSNCTGTFGFGLLTYGTGGDAIRVSDFCLLEDQGLMVAAESLGGLQLTEQGPTGRAFEVLNSGPDPFQRNRVRLSPDENTAGCTPEPLMSVEYVLPNAAAIAAQPNPGFAMLQGYTIPATSLRPAKSQGEVLVGLRHVTQGELTPKTMGLGVVSLGGDVYGTANFSTEGGTMLFERTGGHAYGQATGGLNFKFTDDGGFVAGGMLSATSLRVAGHAPDDMVSLEATIPYVRGHILGSTGSEMLGYGYATGHYVDASGARHAFRASVYVISCLR